MRALNSERSRIPRRVLFVEIIERSRALPHLHPPTRRWESTDCESAAAPPSRPPDTGPAKSRCSNSLFRSAARREYPESPRTPANFRSRCRAHSRPKPRAGKAFEDRARVHEHASRTMRVRLRLHRVDERDVVDVPRHIRQQRADHLAVLPRRRERPRALHQVAVLALKRDKVLLARQSAGRDAFQAPACSPKDPYATRRPGRISATRASPSEQTAPIRGQPLAAVAFASTAVPPRVLARADLPTRYPPTR